MPTSPEPFGCEGLVAVLLARWVRDVLYDDI